MSERMVEIDDEALRDALLASDSPDAPYPYEHEGRVYVMSDQLEQVQRLRSGKRL